MAFTIPHEADAFNNNQSEPDKVDVDILVAGIKGDGDPDPCQGKSQGHGGIHLHPELHEDRFQRQQH